MAIYKRYFESTANTDEYEEIIKIKEMPIYGNQREGIKYIDQKLFKETFTSTSFNNDGTFNKDNVVSTTEYTDNTLALSPRNSKNIVPNLGIESKV